jgi:shikimate kinase
MTQEKIKDIILIGPVRTGKSTIGKLLSEKLQRPQISLDSVRWKYYHDIGYDDHLAKQIRESGGYLALFFYWRLFDAYAAEQVLVEHSNCIIDFGADIYESRESFIRVRNALDFYPNVILILPSPDKEKSLQILKERDTYPPIDLNFHLNRHFLDHYTYYTLAKITVFTEGKTPEETRDEILKLIV